MPLVCRRSWWRPVSLWYRVLSVAVLLLTACMAPPVGPGPGAPSHMAPGSRLPISSDDPGTTAKTDAASPLLLARMVAQQQAQITPVVGGKTRGFRAVQPASGLRLRFAPGGVEVVSAATGRPRVRTAPPEGPIWHLNMTLTGLGYGSEPPPVGSADLVLTDDRLEYRRGSVVEWYRNEPGRLEQGFFLAARPDGWVDGQAERPLRLTLAVESSLTARVDESGQGIEWVDAAGQAGPRYHGLQVVDAHGQAVPSQLTLWSGGVALEIHDGDAEYPLMIDPWVEQAHPVASDGAAGDDFGSSVAISGDTIIVGAYLDDVGTHPWQGSAYVFTRNGTTWTQQQKLTASDGGDEHFFGVGVAISGDTVIVGADQGRTGRGAAYVFTRSGTTWTQQQKLTASDGVDLDRFGIRVSMSGSTAIIGADHGNESRGAAYVFARSGTTWIQEQKLTASDAAFFDQFGLGVAISGSTIVVGSPRHKVGANAAQGSAYVFTRSGTAWTEQQKLTANDGEPSDFFGATVAISGDNAIVGAPFDTVGGRFNQGSAYAFTRSGTTWTQEQKITASDGAAADFFGGSVTISGNTVIVGANNSNASRGAAYVFTRSGSSWTQQQRLTASDGAATDTFGDRVAISGDTVVVGARQDDVGGRSDQGSAYVFAFLTSTATATPSPTATPTPPRTATPTSTPTPALPSGKPPKDDVDKPKRQTEEQSRQQQHTNASNLDQYHTEGNVALVEAATDGMALLVTIALGRGETLVLEVRCSAAGCPEIRPGDYLSADGEQGGRDEAGRFLVEDMTITRAGRHVR